MARPGSCRANGPRRQASKTNDRAPPPIVRAQGRQPAAARSILLGEAPPVAARGSPTAGSLVTFYDPGGQLARTCAHLRTRAVRCRLLRSAPRTASAVRRVQSRRPPAGKNSSAGLPAPRPARKRRARPPPLKSRQNWTERLEALAAPQSRPLPTSDLSAFQPRSSTPRLACQGQGRTGHVRAQPVWGSCGDYAML